MTTRTFSERMARLGYAARGTVYVVIGSLAALAAVGPRGQTTGSKGALHAVLAAPFGRALLGIVALGLLCFAVWRGLQAFLDADRLGRESKALIRRAAYAGSAAIYVGLAISAVRMVIGFSAGGGGENQSAQDWTAFLLSQPFGQWLVAIAGLGVAAAGIAFGLRGYRGTFAERLALDQAARRWVIPMGRFGFMARGLVFVLIGGLLVLAALHANAREAKGLGGALEALQAQPYGWALLGVTAAGLFAFGVFQFVAAVYRRIDAPSMDQVAGQIKDGVKAGHRALGR